MKYMRPTKHLRHVTTAHSSDVIRVDALLLPNSIIIQDNFHNSTDHKASNPNRSLKTTSSTFSDGPFRFGSTFLAFLSEEPD